MINNKGYYTLEASIVVPLILIVLVLFLSLIFTFFYKGYYETKFNQDVISKGYTLNERALKQKTIDIIYLNKTSKIYQRKVEDNYLKGILLQDKIQFAKDWLDE